MKKPRTLYVAHLESLPVLPVIADDGHSSTDDGHSSTDILLTIMRLHESGGYPVNCGWQWDGGRFQPGGMSLRFYSSRWGVSAIRNGRPVTHCDDPREYTVAGTALEVMTKRISEIESKRGNSADSAEFAGRWLEAAGIESVWLRPGFRAHGWHNEGTWGQWTVGHTVEQIRKAILPAHLAHLERQRLEREEWERKARAESAAA